MKRVIILGLFLSGFALLAMGGIGLYHQYNLLMDYCFNPVGYKIISLSHEKFTFEVDLQIKNKSSIDVSITGYDFNISVDGQPATRVKSKTDSVTGGPMNQKLSANDFSILTMVVEFDPRKVFTAIGNITEITKIIAHPETMMIGFNGKVSIEVEGISVKDYNYIDQYSLKDMIPDKNNPSPPCK